MSDDGRYQQLSARVEALETARDGDLLRASATTTQHNETILAVQRTNTRATNAIREDINDLRQEVHDGFAKVDERFNTVDKRLNAIDKRFDTLTSEADARHTSLVAMLREIMDRLPK